VPKERHCLKNVITNYLVAPSMMVQFDAAVLPITKTVKYSDAPYTIPPDRPNVVRENVSSALHRPIQ
jgi:hypothetical protein